MTLRASEESAVSLSKASFKDEYDAIVIGSGMSGLTCAALMAQEGRSVLVLERHYTPGGFTHTYIRKMFEWDIGLHYVGRDFAESSALKSIFDKVSGGAVRWQQMSQVYDRLIYPDREYHFVAGEDAFRENFRSWFPREREGFERYLQAVRDSMKELPLFMLQKAVPPLFAPMTRPFLTNKFNRIASKTTGDVLDGIFKDPRIKAVLTSQYGDYGLPPGKSSFAMHALLVHHYMDGGFYPVGGSQALASAMIRNIKSHGGDVVTRADVDQIVVSSNRVVGVRLKDGRDLKAGQVVSSVGVKNTFNKLVRLEDIGSQGNRAVEGLRQLPQEIGISGSHICINIGIKDVKRLESMPSSNVWAFSGYDHDGSVAAFERHQDAPLPFVYVSFPSLKDPTWKTRFPGRETVQVIGFAPYKWFESWSGTTWKKRGVAYEDFKTRLQNRYLEKVEEILPGICSDPAMIETSTPLSTAHFSNYDRGEIYGLDHSPKRFLESRLGAHTPIKNLFLTGQDLTTAGVGSAIAAGSITACAALKKARWTDLITARSFEQIARIITG